MIDAEQTREKVAVGERVDLQGVEGGGGIKSPGIVKMEMGYGNSTCFKTIHGKNY